ncbi:hypothetical protein PLICBS_006619 [Purpureocillium lilacinum]|uniref:uncharacterized protein n=1 Tax=Purpureocillium lilacinum TaxID=33203 RepID=UPI0020837216|nr:hypothetical protein PLICBS_006619 [Purpureocillium lilacinum]
MIRPQSRFLRPSSRHQFTELPFCVRHPTNISAKANFFAPLIMKTLGLLGGMSWESTTTYYQEINRRVRHVQGGLHSARCVIFSFDFAEIEALQHADKWKEAGDLLNDAAAKLKLAGADAIVLCTNTMHFVSDGIEAASQLPLIHIVDPTADRILQRGFSSVGLLGTRFTMEKEFYMTRLAQRYGLTVIVPDESDRAIVHSIIYTELCNGIIAEASREAYSKVIRNLAKAGAECLILGCTEIGLLVNEADCELPVFDTAQIHATAAADWAMSIEPASNN